MRTGAAVESRYAATLLQPVGYGPPRAPVYGVLSDTLEKVKVGVHRLHHGRMSCQALDDLGVLALCAVVRRERVAQRES